MGCTALFLVAACGSVRGSSVPDSHAGAGETAAVLSAYESYWTAVLDASDPIAIDSSSLQRSATGTELARVRDVLRTMQQAHEVMRGSYTHVDAVAALSSTAATVHDCLTARVQVVSSAKGKTAPLRPSTPMAVDVTMSKGSQGWQVQEIKNGARSCEDPVPDASSSTKPAGA
jgi:hypothetical protein